MLTCVGGVSENPDGIPEHRRREYTNVQVRNTIHERGDKESPKTTHASKIVNPFTCALMPPFYRETKRLLHSKNTLESKEYS
jgi:hypothetical protein